MRAPLIVEYVVIVPCADAVPAELSPAAAVPSTPSAPAPMVPPRMLRLLVDRWSSWSVMEFPSRVEVAAFPRVHHDGR